MAATDTVADADAALLPYRVPAARKRARLFAWGGFALAALCALFLALDPTVAADESQLGMAVLGIVVFAAAGVIGLRRSRSDHDAIVATEAGVTLRAGASDLGPVAWNEIVSVAVKRHKGMRYLGFELREPDRTMSRFGTFQRANGLLGPFLGLEPMMIVGAYVDAPLYDVADRLNAILKAKRGG